LPLFPLTLILLGLPVLQGHARVGGFGQLFYGLKGRVPVFRRFLPHRTLPRGKKRPNQVGQIRRNIAGNHDRPSPIALLLVEPALPTLRRSKLIFNPNLYRFRLLLGLAAEPGQEFLHEFMK
jgi:hypothetical protein